MVIMAKAVGYPLGRQQGAKNDTKVLPHREAQKTTTTEHRRAILVRRHVTPWYYFELIIYLIPNLKRMAYSILSSDIILF